MKKILITVLGILIFSAGCRRNNINNNNTPNTPTLNVLNANWQGGNIAYVIVKLTPATTSTVTVNYSTQDGSVGHAGIEYTAASGTLTFNPGDTVKWFTVPTNVNVAYGTNFLAILSNASGAPIGNDTAGIAIFGGVGFTPFGSGIDSIYIKGTFAGNYFNAQGSLDENFIAEQYGSGNVNTQAQCFGLLKDVQSVGIVTHGSVQINIKMTIGLMV